jgi:hypothetical protein
MNMSEAIRAKSAAERATIAANLLKGTKERNKDLGREFDDCFEMGDGDEVLRLLIERAYDDLALRIAVRRHWQTAPCELAAAVNRISTACDDFRAAGSAYCTELRELHGIASLRGKGAK